MKKWFHFIANFIFYLLVVVVALYFMAGFKYYPLNKATNVYAKGTLLVISSKQKIKIGDKVYIKENKKHQVVKIKNIVDLNSIKTDSVIGPILFGIPFLGIIINYLMTTSGIITMSAIIIISFILNKYIK